MVSIKTLERSRIGCKDMVIAITTPGTVALTVTKLGERNPYMSLEELRKDTCLQCYAIGSLCTGFKAGEIDIKALVRANENQDTAAEKNLAIDKADHLAPCGLLGTALSLLA